MPGQNKRYTPLLRFTALLVVFFFFTTNLGFAQGPSFLPVGSETQVPFRIPDPFEIPSQLGSLSAEHWTTEKTPFIVFLCDAHAVIDAQDHLEELIKHFQKKYGINLICLEGGTGRLDTTLFRTFPDRETKKRVLRSYLEKGELTGAQMASVFSEREGKYYGIEDWELYEGNYLAYLKALKNQGGILKDLERLEQSLDGERKRIYSPEHNEFHEKVRAFREEKINLLELVKYLKDHETRSRKRAADNKKNRTERDKEKGARSAIRPVPFFLAKHPELSKLFALIDQDVSMNKEDLEVGIRHLADQFKREHASSWSRKARMAFNGHYQDFVTGRMDRGVFVQYLMNFAHQEGHPLKISASIRALLSHSETLSMIKGTKLLEELESFLRNLEERFVQGPAERELQAKYDRMDILRDLAQLQIDRAKLEKFQKDQNAYFLLLAGARPRFVVGSTESQASSDDREARNVLTPALDFYQLALAREEALYRNLLEVMKKEKAPAAVVILGGFHTQGFEEKLKKDQHSYAIVTPKMSSLQGHEQYGEIMQGRLSYRDFLQTTFYDAFVRHSSLRMVSELNEPDFRKILKSWRDDVIRKLSGEKRLGEASRYTRYIDLLLKVYLEKFGARNLTHRTREQILKDIEKELQNFKDRSLKKVMAQFQDRVSRLTQGLKGFIARKELTEDNVQSLIHEIKTAKPAALAEIANALFTPDAHFGANREAAGLWLEFFRQERSLDALLKEFGLLRPSAEDIKEALRNISQGVLEAITKTPEITTVGDRLLEAVDPQVPVSPESRQAANVIADAAISAVQEAVREKIPDATRGAIAKGLLDQMSRNRDITAGKPKADAPIEEITGAASFNKAPAATLLPTERATLDADASAPPSSAGSMGYGPLDTPSRLSVYKGNGRFATAPSIADQNSRRESPAGIDRAVDREKRILGEIPSVPKVTGAESGTGNAEGFSVASMNEVKGTTVTAFAAIGEMLGSTLFKNLLPDSPIVLLRFLWGKEKELTKESLISTLNEGASSMFYNRVNGPVGFSQIEYQDGKKSYAVLISEVQEIHPDSPDGMTTGYHVTSPNRASMILKVGKLGLPGRTTFWVKREDARYAVDAVDAMGVANDQKGQELILAFKLPNEHLLLKQDSSGKDTLAPSFSNEINETVLGIGDINEIINSETISQEDVSRVKSLDLLESGAKTGFLTRFPPESIDPGETINVNLQRVREGKLKSGYLHDLLEAFRDRLDTAQRVRYEKAFQTVLADLDADRKEKVPGTTAGTGATVSPAPSSPGKTESSALGVEAPAPSQQSLFEGGKKPAAGLLGANAVDRGSSLGVRDKPQFTSSEQRTAQAPAAASLGDFVETILGKPLRARAIDPDRTDGVIKSDGFNVVPLSALPPSDLMERFWAENKRQEDKAYELLGKDPKAKVSFTDSMKLSLRNGSFGRLVADEFIVDVVRLAWDVINARGGFAFRVGEGSDEVLIVFPGSLDEKAVSQVLLEVQAKIENAYLNQRALGRLSASLSEADIQKLRAQPDMMAIHKEDGQEGFMLFSKKAEEKAWEKLNRITAGANLDSAKAEVESTLVPFLPAGVVTVDRSKGPKDLSSPESLREFLSQNTARAEDYQKEAKRLHKLVGVEGLMVIQEKEKKAQGPSRAFFNSRDEKEVLSRANNAWKQTANSKYKVEDKYAVYAKSELQRIINDIVKDPASHVGTHLIRGPPDSFYLISVSEDGTWQLVLLKEAFVPTRNGTKHQFEEEQAKSGRTVRAEGVYGAKIPNEVFGHDYLDDYILYLRHQILSSKRAADLTRQDVSGLLKSLSQEVNAFVQKDGYQIQFEATAIHSDDLVESQRQGAVVSLILEKLSDARKSVKQSKGRREEGRVRSYGENKNQTTWREIEEEYNEAARHKAKRNYKVLLKEHALVTQARAEEILDGTGIGGAVVHDVLQRLMDKILDLEAKDLIQRYRITNEIFLRPEVIADLAKVLANVHEASQAKRFEELIQDILRRKGSVDVPPSEAVPSAVITGPLIQGPGQSGTTGQPQVQFVQAKNYDEVMEQVTKRILDLLSQSGKLRQQDFQDARQIIETMESLYDTLGLSKEGYHNQPHNLLVPYGGLEMAIQKGLIQTRDDLIVAFLGGILHDLHPRKGLSPASVAVTLNILESILSKGEITWRGKLSEAEFQEIQPNLAKLQSLVNGLLDRSENRAHLSEIIKLLVLRTDFNPRPASTDWLNGLRKYRNALDRYEETGRSEDWEVVASGLENLKSLRASAQDEFNRLSALKGQKEATGVEFSQEEKKQLTDAANALRVFDIEIAYFNQLQTFDVSERHARHRLANTLEKSDQAAIYALLAPEFYSDFIVPGLADELRQFNIRVTNDGTYLFFMVAEFGLDDPVTSAALRSIASLPVGYRLNFLRVLRHFAELGGPKAVAHWSLHWKDIATTINISTAAAEANGIKDLVEQVPGKLRIVNTLEELKDANVGLNGSKGSYAAGANGAQNGEFRVGPREFSESANAATPAEKSPTAVLSPEGLVPPSSAGSMGYGPLDIPSRLSVYKGNGRFADAPSSSNQSISSQPGTLGTATLIEADSIDGLIPVPSIGILPDQIPNESVQSRAYSALDHILKLRRAKADNDKLLEPGRPLEDLQMYLKNYRSINTSLLMAGKSLEELLRNNPIVDEYEFSQKIFDILSFWDSYDSQDKVLETFGDILKSQVLLQKKAGRLVGHFFQYLQSHPDIRTSQTIALSMIKALPQKEEADIEYLSGDRVKYYLNVLKNMHVAPYDGLLLGATLLCASEHNRFDEIGHTLWELYGTEVQNFLIAHANDTLPQESLAIQTTVRTLAIHILFTRMQFSAGSLSPEEVIRRIHHVQTLQSSGTTASMVHSLDYSVEFVRELPNVNVLITLIAHEFSHRVYKADLPTEEFIADVFAFALLERLGLDDQPFMAHAGYEKYYQDYLNDHVQVTEEHEAARSVLHAYIKLFREAEPLETRTTGASMPWNRLVELIDRVFGGYNNEQKISFGEFKQRFEALIKESGILKTINIPTPGVRAASAQLSAEQVPGTTVTAQPVTAALSPEGLVPLSSAGSMGARLSEIKDFITSLRMLVRLVAMPFISAVWRSLSPTLPAAIIASLGGFFFAMPNPLGIPFHAWLQAEFLFGGLFWVGFSLLFSSPEITASLARARREQQRRKQETELLQSKMAAPTPTHAQSPTPAFPGTGKAASRGKPVVAASLGKGPFGRQGRGDFIRTMMGLAAAVTLGSSSLLEAAQNFATPLPQKPSDGLGGADFTPETVRHANGKAWTWPARNKTTNDYPLRGAVDRKTDLRRPGRMAKGGFDIDLKLWHSFGTFAELTDKSEIDGLFRQYQKAGSIPQHAKFEEALRVLAGDQIVFYALRQFLKDKGRFELWPSSAHYDDEKLVISVGMDKGGIELQSTIYHEMLHYILDKMDALISEVPDRGGADHLLIAPLQERMFILLSIRHGKLPLDKDIRSLYGFAAAVPGGEAIKLGEEISTYLAAENFMGLKRMIESDRFFYTPYVHAAMVTPLSTAAYGRLHPEDFPFPLSEADLQDLAHLSAFNAQILKAAFLIGLEFLRKSNRSLSDKNLRAVFTSTAYQEIFGRFMTELTKTLEKPPEASLRDSADSILKGLSKDIRQAASLGSEESEYVAEDVAREIGIREVNDDGLWQGYIKDAAIQAFIGSKLENLSEEEKREKGKETLVRLREVMINRELQRILFREKQHSDGLKQAATLYALKLSRDLKSGEGVDSIAPKVVRWIRELAKDEQKYGPLGDTGEEYEVKPKRTFFANVRETYPKETAKIIMESILGGRLGSDWDSEYAVIEYANYPSRSWRVQEEIKALLKDLGFLPTDHPWQSRHTSMGFYNSAQTLDAIRKIIGHIAFTDALLHIDPTRLKFFAASHLVPMAVKGGLGNVAELPGTKPYARVEEERAGVLPTRLEFRMGDTTSLDSSKTTQVMHGLMMQAVLTALKLKGNREEWVSEFERRIITILDDFVSAIDDIADALAKEGDQSMREVLNKDWFGTADNQLLLKIVALQNNAAAREKIQQALSTLLTEADEALEQMPELLATAADTTKKNVLELSLIKKLMGEITNEMAARLNLEYLRNIPVITPDIRRLLEDWRHEPQIRQIRHDTPRFDKLTQRSLFTHIIEETRFPTPDREFRVLLQVPEREGALQNLNFRSILSQSFLHNIEVRLLNFHFQLAYPNIKSIGILGMITFFAWSLTALALYGLGTISANGLVNNVGWGGLTGLGILLVSEIYQRFLRDIHDGHVLDALYASFSLTGDFDTLRARVEQEFFERPVSGASVVVAEDIIEMGMADFEANVLTGRSDSEQDKARNAFGQGYFFDSSAGVLDAILYVNTDRKERTVRLGQPSVYLRNQRFTNNSLFDGIHQTLYIHKSAAASSPFALGFVLAHEKGKRRFFELENRFPFLSRTGWLGAEIMGKAFELSYLTGDRIRWVGEGMITSVFVGIGLHVSMLFSWGQVLSNYINSAQQKVSQFLNRFRPQAQESTPVAEPPTTAEQVPGATEGAGKSPTAQSMGEKPFSPIDSKDLPGFARFVLRKGMLYGSRWDWLRQSPYSPDVLRAQRDAAYYHKGMDFAEYQTTDGDILPIPADTVVRAVAPGKVVAGEIGKDEVYIETLDGMKVRYGHTISSVDVETEVQAGDVIGRIYQHSTMAFMPPHLHLEVIRSRDYILETVDPLSVWPELTDDMEIGPDDTIVGKASGRFPTEATSLLGDGLIPLYNQDSTAALSPEGLVPLSSAGSMGTSDLENLLHERDSIKDIAITSENGQKVADWVRKELQALHGVGLPTPYLVSEHLRLIFRYLSSRLGDTPEGRVLLDSLKITVTDKQRRGGRNIVINGQPVVAWAARGGGWVSSFDESLDPIVTEFIRSYEYLSSPGLKSLLEFAQIAGFNEVKAMLEVDGQTFRLAEVRETETRKVSLIYVSELGEIPFRQATVRVRGVRGASRWLKLLVIGRDEDGKEKEILAKLYSSRRLGREENGLFPSVFEELGFLLERLSGKVLASILPKSTLEFIDHGVKAELEKSLEAGIRETMKSVGSEGVLSAADAIAQGKKISRSADADYSVPNDFISGVELWKLGGVIDDNELEDILYRANAYSMLSVIPEVNIRDGQYAAAEERLNNTIIVMQHFDDPLTLSNEPGFSRVKKSALTKALMGPSSETFEPEVRRTGPIKPDMIDIYFVPEHLLPIAREAFKGPGYKIVSVRGYDDLEIMGVKVKAPSFLTAVREQISRGTDGSYWMTAMRLPTLEDVRKELFNRSKKTGNEAAPSSAPEAKGTATAALSPEGLVPLSSAGSMGKETFGGWFDLKRDFRGYSASFERNGTTGIEAIEKSLEIDRFSFNPDAVKSIEEVAFYIDPKVGADVAEGIRHVLADVLRGRKDIVDKLQGFETLHVLVLDKGPTGAVQFGNHIGINKALVESLADESPGLKNLILDVFLRAAIDALRSEVSSKDPQLGIDRYHLERNGYQVKPQEIFGWINKIFSPNSQMASAGHEEAVIWLYEEGARHQVKRDFQTMFLDPAFRKGIRGVTVKFLSGEVYPTKMRVIFDRGQEFEEFVDLDMEREDMEFFFSAIGENAVVGSEWRVEIGYFPSFVKQLVFPMRTSPEEINEEIIKKLEELPDQEIDGKRFGLIYHVEADRGSIDGKKLTINIVEEPELGFLSKSRGLMHKSHSPLEVFHWINQFNRHWQFKDGSGYWRLRREIRTVTNDTTLMPREKLERILESFRAFAEGKKPVDREIQVGGDPVQSIDEAIRREPGEASFSFVEELLTRLTPPAIETLPTAQSMGLLDLSRKELEGLVMYPDAGNITVPVLAEGLRIPVRLFQKDTTGLYVGTDGATHLFLHSKIRGETTVTSLTFANGVFRLIEGEIQPGQRLSSKSMSTRNFTVEYDSEGEEIIITNENAKVAVPVEFVLRMKRQLEGNSVDPNYLFILPNPHDSKNWLIVASEHILPQGQWKLRQFEADSAESFRTAINEALLKTTGILAVLDQNDKNRIQIQYPIDNGRQYRYVKLDGSSSRVADSTTGVVFGVDDESRLQMEEALRIAISLAGQISSQTLREVPDASGTDRAQSMGKSLAAGIGMEESIYQDIQSLERDIRTSETEVVRRGLGNLPRIGIHGEQAGRQPEGGFWYFLLDPHLEDYWRVNWRGDPFGARLTMRRGTLALADVFMAAPEMFERLQGTVIFTANYGRTEGVRPDLYLVVQRDDVELPDTTTKPDVPSVVSISSLVGGRKEHRFLFVEGRVPSERVPPDTIKLSISDREYEALVVLGRAEAARQNLQDPHDLFAKDLMYRLLYRKVLHALLALPEFNSRLNEIIPIVPAAPSSAPEAKGTATAALSPEGLVPLSSAGSMGKVNKTSVTTFGSIREMLDSNLFKGIAAETKFIFLPFHWEKASELSKSELVSKLTDPESEVYATVGGDIALSEIEYRDGTKNYAVLISEVPKVNPVSSDGMTVGYHITSSEKARGILKGGMFGLPGRAVLWAREERAEYNAREFEFILVFRLPNAHLLLSTSYSGMTDMLAPSFSEEIMGALLDGDYRQALGSKVSASEKTEGSLTDLLDLGEKTGLLIHFLAQSVDLDATFNLNLERARAGKLQPDRMKDLLEAIENRATDTQFAKYRQALAESMSPPESGLIAAALSPKGLVPLSSAGSMGVINTVAGESSFVSRVLKSRATSNERRDTTPVASDAPTTQASRLTTVAATSATGAVAALNALALPEMIKQIVLQTVDVWKKEAVIEQGGLLTVLDDATTRLMDEISRLQSAEAILEQFPNLVAKYFGQVEGLTADDLDTLVLSVELAGLGVTERVEGLKVIAEDISPEELKALGRLFSLDTGRLAEVLGKALDELRRSSNPTDQKLVNDFGLERVSFDKLSFTETSNFVVSADVIREAGSPEKAIAEITRAAKTIIAFNKEDSKFVMDFVRRLRLAAATVATPLTNAKTGNSPLLVLANNNDTRFRPGAELTGLKYETSALAQVKIDLRTLIRLTMAVALTKEIRDQLKERDNSGLPIVDSETLASLLGLFIRLAQTRAATEAALRVAA